MTCRQLNQNDDHVFQQFLQKRIKSSFISSPFEQGDSRRSQKLGSNFLVYGVFNGLEIQSYLAVHRWRAMPYFTLCDLASLPNLGTRVLIDHFLILFEQALVDMIMERRFGFYYIMKPSHFSLSDKNSNRGESWLQSKAPFLRKYFFSFEHLAVGGSECQYESIALMLGTKTPHRTYILRKGSIYPKAFFKLINLLDKGSSADDIRKFMCTP